MRSHSFIKLTTPSGGGQGGHGEEQIFSHGLTQINTDFTDYKKSFRVYRLTELQKRAQQRGEQIFRHELHGLTKEL